MAHVPCPVPISRILSGLKIGAKNVLPPKRIFSISYRMSIRSISLYKEVSRYDRFSLGFYIFIPDRLDIGMLEWYQYVCFPHILMKVASSCSLTSFTVSMITSAMFADIVIDALCCCLCTSKILNKYICITDIKSGNAIREFLAYETVLLISSEKSVWRIHQSRTKYGETWFYFRFNVGEFIV